MEDSTQTLLYTATYVFIFVIAISLSIILYMSVIKYSDIAFSYKESIDSSIINVGTTGTEIEQTGKVYLTPDEVFSYYVNYIKKDIYGESKPNTDIEIKIEGINDNSLSYNDAYTELVKNNQYFYQYGEENGKPQITITPVK